MSNRPRDFSQEVMEDELQYPLVNTEGIDYPYFKQVLALYWIEQDTKMS